MGIITKLSLKATRDWLQKTYGITPDTLTPTDSGISDTTYILTSADGRRLVLKRFETASHMLILEEHALLKALRVQGLNVPLPLAPETAALFDGKPAFLYTALPGCHPGQPETEQIKAVGDFLGRFHSLSEGRQNSYPTFAEQCRELASVIAATPFAPYVELLNAMQDEPADGIIHGDLFPDNALFEGEKLGVIDWIEACEGPFGFDLGVVAFSWCIEGDSPLPDKLAALADAYQSAYSHTSLSKEALHHYAAQAALFYGLRRYLRCKDADHPGVAECRVRLKNLIGQ